MEGLLNKLLIHSNIEKASPLIMPGIVKSNELKCNTKRYQRLTLQLQEKKRGNAR